MSSGAGDDVTEILGRLYRKIEALEEENKTLRAEVDELKKPPDAPSQPPTHLGTPMQISVGFQSVAYTGRYLGEGRPPYVE